jgi:polyhydroxyalkanoate synthesis repressor PhaR
MSPESHAKVIKRYANRKLYDTERSCYVTLEEIADMVKSGEDVRILDNRTGEDLTGVTLTQIIFEDQKQRPDARPSLPLGALRGIIQSGGEILSRISPPKWLASRSPERSVERQVVYDLPEAAQRMVRMERAANAPTSNDVHVDALHARLDEVEETLARLEKQLKVVTKVVTDLQEDLRRNAPKSRSTLP